MVFHKNIGGLDIGNPGSYFYPFKGNWGIPTTGKSYKFQAYNGGQKGDFLTDVLTDEAVNFIKGQKKPFMLYFSYYGVHSPFQAKKDKIAKYKKKAPKLPGIRHTYAGMVESIDDSVGRVIKTLKDKGIYDETVIIFTSDNGGHSRATDHSPLRGNKGSYYEGGIRVPFIVRVPGVKAGESDQMICSNDVYPTVLDALGQPLKPHQHLDGISVLPALKGEQLKRDRLFWHFPHYNGHPSAVPSSVIRKGDWKLIQTYDPKGIELYNLNEDISEKNNLASHKSDKVNELMKDLQQWKASVDAEEMKPNPEYSK